MKICYAIFLMLIINGGYAQIAKQERYDPVVLTGSQLIKFRSAVNSHDYTVAIQLPSSYNDSVSKKYPVIYALDGQWSFAPTLGLMGGLNFDGLVPEAIVVAIGWPDNYDANRARDLTPSVTQDAPGTGGAPLFFDVMKKEIRSFVDQNYRTDTLNRILVGGSYGGLYIIYSLFREPALFNAYIIGSPSVEYDNDLVFKYEKEFARTHKELNAKVFFHWGKFEADFDQRDGFEKFVSQMRNSKYRGLKMDTVVVEHMSHASNGPYGVGRGLLFVLQRPDIELDPKLLETYIGKFEESVTITREGKHIYLNLPGIKTRLRAISNNLFYVPGLPGNAEFVIDTNGKVTGYRVIMPGGATMVAKKLP